jgi:hypothetical protein
MIRKKYAEDLANKAIVNVIQGLIGMKEHYCSRAGLTLQMFTTKIGLR